MFGKTLAVATGAVLLVGLAHAQYDSQDKPLPKDKTHKSSDLDRPGGQAQQTVRIHRLGRFIDRDVQIGSGEDIGDIENFALDLNQGKVSFVILNVDNDISDGLLPVPYEAFDFKQAGSGNQPIALKVDKAQLRNAPTFRENDWATLNDPQYVQRLHSHYKIQTSSSGSTNVEIERDPVQPRPHIHDDWDDADQPGTNYPGSTGNPRGGAAGNPDEASRDARRDRVRDDNEWTDDHREMDRNDRPTQQRTQMHTSKHSMVRANHLIGADIEDRSNRDVGELEDVLVDLQNGRIVYAVLSSGGVLGMGDTLHPVPVQALEVKGSAQNPQFVLDIDADRMDEAPTLRGDEIPTTFDPQLTQEIVAFYDVSDPGFVYGFAEDQETRRLPDQSRGVNMKSMQSIMNNWPEVSQRAAQEMMQKYGQPDMMGNSMFVWENKGPWKRTVVYGEPVSHEFPMAHQDVLEQTISYKVPVDMYDDLARFDGSVIAFRTGGELSARCDKEPMNFLALNLAHEIATGKRTAEDARQFYAQTAREFMQGESSEYTTGLMFQAGGSNAADPDRPASESGEPMNRDNSNRRR